MHRCETMTGIGHMRWLQFTKDAVLVQ